MPIPPPPPASSEREKMIRELEGAETADLLALCQRFSRSPERLQLYLSVFRRRPSPSAQLAACLLCFDLARQGSTSARREFATLAISLEPLARDEALVDGLLGDDPWLRALWNDCREAMASHAPELEVDTLEVELEDVLELDLLSGDEELEALEFEVLEIEPEEEIEELVLEEAELEPVEVSPSRPPPPPPLVTPVRREAMAALDRLLLAHLGITTGRGFEPGRAFGLKTARDIDAVERLVASIEPLGEALPTAAGLCFLLRMQLALAQRQTGLFGRSNPRRRTLLTEALRSFPRQPAALESVELLVQLGDDACRHRLRETVSLVGAWFAMAARQRRDPAEVIEPFLDELEG